MKLTIAGIGIHSHKQLTLEALEAIREAGQVLILPIAAAELENHLASLGVAKLENLKSLYINGDHDRSNYDRILGAVLEACRRHPSVCLLVPGHPRIGVTLVQLLEQVAVRDKTFRLRVLAGVSSFDTMINQLGLDPLEKGSVVVDANCSVPPKRRQFLVTYSHPADVSLGGVIPT